MVYATNERSVIWLKVSLAALLILCSFMIVFTFFRDEIMRGTSSCEERILQQVNSPSGGYTAILYFRSCDKNSLHVNLVKEGDELKPFDSSGIIFDGQVFEIAISPEIVLSWENENDLEIFYQNVVNEPQHKYFWDKKKVKVNAAEKIQTPKQ